MYFTQILSEGELVTSILNVLGTYAVLIQIFPRISIQPEYKEARTPPAPPSLTDSLLVSLECPTNSMSPFKCLVSLHMFSFG